MNKKVYLSPKSENVQLDPLMVAFGMKPQSINAAQDGATPGSGPVFNE